MSKADKIIAAVYKDLVNKYKREYADEVPTAAPEQDTTTWRGYQNIGVATPGNITWASQPYQVDQGTAGGIGGVQHWHQQGVANTIVGNGFTTGTGLTLAHAQHQGAFVQAGNTVFTAAAEATANHIQEHLNTLTPAGQDLDRYYNDNEDEE